jgi:hypothetical protein
VDEVEARLAGGELDHRLLALLLLGNLLGLDLDAGQVGEFLDVLLEVVAARSLGEDHLELGAGVFLPVHLRMGRKARQGKAARRRGAGQNSAARNPIIFHPSPPMGTLVD